MAKKKKVEVVIHECKNCVHSILNGDVELHCITKMIDNKTFKDSSKVSKVLECWLFEKKDTK